MLALRPNCECRPIRPADKLVKYPASRERKLKPEGCPRAAWGRR